MDLVVTIQIMNLIRKANIQMEEKGNVLEDLDREGLKRTVVFLTTSSALSQCLFSQCSQSYTDDYRVHREFSRTPAFHIEH